jgi:hypothetical protein
LFSPFPLDSRGIPGREKSFFKVFEKCIEKKKDEVEGDIKNNSLHTLQK